MSKPRKPATLAVTGGRDPRRFLGAINTPVFRASTIAFRDVAELERAERGEREASLGPVYGLHGLPTVTDLQAALAELEGGAAAYAVPSGLTATTLPFLALCRAGDHVLVTDSVYFPTRRFCATTLARFGIDVEFYDPLIGAGIEAMMRASTRAGVRRVAGLADVRRAGRAGDRSASRMRTARSWSPTTPGRRRCSSARSTTVPTSRCTR